MKLTVQKHRYAVCKLTEIPPLIDTGTFFSLTTTAQEISYVCREEFVPQKNWGAEKGWAAMKVEGHLDFSLIGIIAQISRILAEAQISIFVISTFDTDYILLKQQTLDRAIQMLTEGGYEIGRDDIKLPAPVK